MKNFILIFFVLLAGCTRSQQDQVAKTEPALQVSPTTPSGRSMPPRLAAFLQANSDYRILNFEDLGGRKDSYPGESEWKPFALGDTNGDGREDIIAVVVKKSSAAPFNVICLHGNADANAQTEVLWPIRDSAELIMEVIAEQKEIWPLFCKECDANRPMRWVGNGYEWGIYSAGEDACLLEGTRVYEAPDVQAPLAAILKRTRDAEIVEMGKKVGDKERWYKVRSRTASDAFTGWVAKYNDEEPGICEEPSPSEGGLR
jgi:hypothetical protein